MHFIATVHDATEDKFIQEKSRAQEGFGVRVRVSDSAAPNMEHWTLFDVGCLPAVVPPTEGTKAGLPAEARASEA